MSIDRNTDEKKRLKIVEYAYYRLYLFFKWFKRDILPEGSAAIFLSTWAGFMILIIARLFEIQILIDNFINIGIVLMLFYFWFFARSKKLKLILDKYKDETNSDKYNRGIIVYGLFVLTHIVGCYLYYFH